MDNNEVNLKKEKRNRVIFIIASIFVVLVIILGVGHCVSVFMNKSGEEEGNSNTVVDDSEKDISNNATEESNNSVIATSGDYEVIKYSDKYYLLYNDINLGEVEVSDDYTPAIIKNTEIDEYVGVVCYTSDNPINCVIGEKKLSDDNYVLMSYYGKNSFNIIMYNVLDGTYTLYDDIATSGILAKGYFTEDYTNYSVINYRNYNDNNSILSDFYTLLINRKTGSVIKIIDYFLYGDEVLSTCSDDLCDIYTYNENYIIVDKKSSKDEFIYGLIDIYNNIVIPIEYEGLVQSTDGSVVLAKKNGKFGAIDYNNNVIVDFNYDGIIKVDNYYIVLLNNKIQILDEKGSLILDTNYEVNSQFASEFPFEFRSQAAEMYYVSESDGIIKINYAYEYSKYKWLYYDPLTNTITEGETNSAW